MGDIFFEADAHDEDHWRYWGRPAYEQALRHVASQPNHGLKLSDLHRAAIEYLKKQRDFSRESRP